MNYDHCPKINWSSVKCMVFGYIWNNNWISISISWIIFVVLWFGHLSNPGVLSNTDNSVIFSILCRWTELGAVNSPGNLNYDRRPKINWASVKCLVFGHIWNMYWISINLVQAVWIMSVVLWFRHLSNPGFLLNTDNIVILR